MPIVGRLPHRLGIILPSRDHAGRKLPENARQALRRTAENWFAKAFPGFTEDRLQIRPRLRGRWGSGSSVTVEEVEEIWVYCSAADFRKHRRGLMHLAEWVAAKADQDAVAILVDSGMEIVTRESEEP